MDCIFIITLLYNFINILINRNQKEKTDCTRGKIIQLQPIHLNHHEDRDENVSGSNFLFLKYVDISCVMIYPFCNSASLGYVCMGYLLTVCFVSVGLVWSVLGLRLTVCF